VTARASPDDHLISTNRTAAAEPAPAERDLPVGAVDPRFAIVPVSEDG
jgi:hypothetical protein